MYRIERSMKKLKTVKNCPKPVIKCKIDLNKFLGHKTGVKQGRQKHLNIYKKRILESLFRSDSEPEGINLPKKIKETVDSFQKIKNRNEETQHNTMCGETYVASQYRIISKYDNPYITMQHEERSTTYNNPHQRLTRRDYNMSFEMFDFDQPTLDRLEEMALQIDLLALEQAHYEKVCKSSRDRISCHPGIIFEYKKCEQEYNDKITERGSKFFNNFQKVYSLHREPGFLVVIFVEIMKIRTQKTKKFMTLPTKPSIKKCRDLICLMLNSQVCYKFDHFFKVMIFEEFNLLFDEGYSMQYVNNLESPSRLSVSFASPSGDNGNEDLLALQPSTSKLMNLKDSTRSNLSGI